MSSSSTTSSSFGKLSEAADEGQSGAVPRDDPEALFRPSGVQVRHCDSSLDSLVSQCTKCLEHTVFSLRHSSSANFLCDACDSLSEAPGHPVNIPLTHPSTETASCLSVFDAHTLYVQGHIMSTPVQLCVDTGSAISLINMAAWHSLCGNLNHSSVLSPSTVSVSSVNGASVRVVGTAQLELALGDNFRTLHSFLVADIEPPGILGLDFLRSHDCVIKLSPPSLSVPSATVPLVRLSSASACLPTRFVRLQSPAVIPPYSQIIVPAQVTGASDICDEGCWIMDPRQTLLDKHALAMPATVAHVREGIISVRFLNLTSEPTTLPTHTIVGELQPCLVLDEEPESTSSDE